MAEWLGPLEPWPRHPRPLARAALRDAAAAGWHLRKSNGHSFGTLKCPAKGTPGACTVVVFSTSGAADGSETAREIRKALRACPHRNDIEHAQQDAEAELSDEVIEARVRRLLEAVDGLDRRERSEAGLDQAIERDDVGAFEEHSRGLTEADNDAQIALAELGLPLDPWPPSVGRAELLEEAKDFSRRAMSPDVLQRLTAMVEQVRP